MYLLADFYLFTIFWNAETDALIGLQNSNDLLKSKQTEHCNKLQLKTKQLQQYQVMFDKNRMRKVVRT